MKKKIIIISLIFLFSIILRLYNLYQVGRTYDEIAYVTPGYIFLNLAKKYDFNNPAWWNHPDEPPLARYIYSLGAQLDFTGTDNHGHPKFNYDFHFTRLTSVIFSSLAVVIVTLIGWEFISISVGILAGIILSLVPFFLGFSQLATLESFIMFFFSTAIYCYLKILKKPSIKKTILLGLIFGCAISIKPTNLLLLPTFFFMFINWYFLNHKSSHPKRSFQEIVTCLKNPRFLTIVYATCIAAITFIALWPMPFFHLDYVITFNKQLRFSSHYSIPEIFFGKLHLTPVYYYIVLFLITTPLIILILFISGLFKIKHSKSWIRNCLLLWFLVPFLQSFYPMRQQGVRYIIEIYAPLSLISAIGFYHLLSTCHSSLLARHSAIIGGSRIFKAKSISRHSRVHENPGGKKSLFLLTFLSLTVLILYLLIIDYHVSPYYIDYYNELVGGSRGVHQTKISQLGWWGEGTKAAINYLEQIAPPRAKVAIAGNQLVVAPSPPKLILSNYDKKKNYNYIVLNYYTLTREGFNDTEIKQKYTLIHTITVDQAPLVYIFKKK